MGGYGKNAIEKKHAFKNISEHFVIHYTITL